MPAVLASLLLALRQLADPRVIRILLKTLAVSIGLFVLVALAGWYAIDALLDWAGLDAQLFAGAEAARQIASLMLALLGLWLAWRVVAMAVIQFYADEVVQAVEARHYAGATAQGRDLPVTEQVTTSVRAALRALLINLAVLPFALILLLTGLGTALLFWLVNALLIGRELQDMVWLRHRRSPAQTAPVSRTERFLLGGTIAAMLAVPGINFIAPILGAAAATHLIHRAARLERETG